MIDKAAILEEFKHIRKLLIFPQWKYHAAWFKSKSCLGWPSELVGPSHSRTLPGVQIKINTRPLQILTKSLSQISFTIMYLRLCSENSSQRNHDQRNCALVERVSKLLFTCNRKFKTNHLQLIASWKLLFIFNNLLKQITCNVLPLKRCCSPEIENHLVSIAAQNCCSHAIKNM